MKLLEPLVCLCAFALGAPLARGQNLYFDFNQTDTFTHNFLQNSQGLNLAWSATGGIEDQAGAAGGGVISTGSGQATVEHKGAPTVSLNTGLAYNFSIFVKLNSVGVAGDTIVALTLGEKALLHSGEGRGISAVFENIDGTHIGVGFVYRDPAIYQVPPSGLFFQPALGHWVQVFFSIQENVVAAGNFNVAVTVRDFGTTGVGTGPPATTVGDELVDNVLSGKEAAGWVPMWSSTISGLAYDNLVVGIADPGLGRFVVGKGDPAPGIPGTVFDLIGNPAVGNGGDVAFQARVAGAAKGSGVTASNNSGIWLYTPAGGALVAQTGKTSTPAPGTNGAGFAKLSDPLATKNALGFYATLIPGTGDATSKNDAGVWTQNGGPLGVFVRKGHPAPGLNSGATISAITQFGIEGSGAASVLGTASGAGLNSSNHTCLWLPDSSDTLQLVFQSSQHFQAFTPQKFVAGQSRSVDAINGRAAVILESDQTKALGVAAPTGLTTPQASGFTTGFAAEVGNTAPGFTGANAPTIKSFGLPAINAHGTIAFSFGMEGGGVQSSNDNGIGFLPAGGTASLPARTGNVAPGTTGAVFSTLSAPVLCNTAAGPGAIAFVGGLTRGVGDTEKNGANAQGIWTNIKGPMQLFVRQGDSVREGGAFASFGQIALTDSGVVIFEGTISGVPSDANQGIWYCSAPGEAILAARTGALVQVGATMKTIKSLRIFPISTNSMGQTRSFDPVGGDFAYVATFTDNTWGLFVVRFA